MHLYLHPTRALAEFKAIITDFMWNHGKSKIAYNLMIQDIQDGGLQLADLETRVKVIHLNWIKFMCGIIQIHSSRVSAKESYAQRTSLL